MKLPRDTIPLENHYGNKMQMSNQGLAHAKHGQRSLFNGPVISQKGLRTKFNPALQESVCLHGFNIHSVTSCVFYKNVTSSIRESYNHVTLVCPYKA